MDTYNYPVEDQPLEYAPGQPKAPGNSTADTIRSVIKQVKGAGLALAKKWYILLIAAGLGFLWGWYLDIKGYEPPRYGASYLFNLETQSGGGGLSDLAGAFGFGAGPADNSMFVGENFYILFQSRPLMDQMLLTKVDTGSGQKILLANYYIEKSGILNMEWKDDEKNQKFRFDINKPRSAYTVDEVMVLNQLREKINVNTSIGQMNKKSTYITLVVAAENEKLAMILSKAMLETITHFYKTNQTRKTLELLDVAKKRRDSLKVSLYSNENRMARYIDQNQLQIMAQGQLEQQRNSRNTSLVNGMYMEALRNVETIQNSLIRETPLVTIIDSPEPPLQKEFYPGRKKKFGIVLGVIVGIIFILSRRWYLSIMNA